MKKFLDSDGVSYLYNKLSLNDYPNNETLASVINAIDETKVDKTYLNKIFNSYTLIGSYNKTNTSSTTQENYNMVLSDSLANYCFLYFYIKSENFYVGQLFLPMSIVRSTGDYFECNCINDQNNSYNANFHYVSDTQLQGKVSGKATEIKVFGVGKIN